MLIHNIKRNTFLVLGSCTQYGAICKQTVVKFQTVSKSMDNKELLKTYDKKIMVDKISGGKYDTYSPHSTTLHRHNDFQIVWIAKGSGIHTIDQEKYVYDKGSIFLLAPHFMHQMEYGENVEGYVVSFSDTFFNNHQYKSTLLFYNPYQCYIKIMGEEIALLNREFATLYHYYKEWHYTDEEVIMQNYLQIILTKINAFRTLSHANKISDSNQNVLEKFISLVRDNFSQEKNLTFYQNNLAISQRKLHYVISETTGLSPAKYIEQYTLNEAARLILYTNYSIKEIAATLGYMDNSYFTKSFKKHFNKTPSQYKNESSKF